MYTFIFAINLIPAWKTGYNVDEQVKFMQLLVNMNLIITLPF